MKALESRKTPVPSWYLDMSMVKSYWGDERKYHHTAPINMLYAFREALRIIAEEGLEERFARHKLNHRALVSGIEAMGLSMGISCANDCRIGSRGHLAGAPGRCSPLVSLAGTGIRGDVPGVGCDYRFDVIRDGLVPIVSHVAPFRTCGQVNQNTARLPLPC